jgi:hypothetical protein
MKQFEYEIQFEGASEEIVSASSFTSAVILALEERIKKGFHLRATAVILKETGEFCELDPRHSFYVHYTSIIKKKI